MDDGFQNPTLEKNLSVVTVDSRGFLGNGRVIPAGPLRASLKFQLDKTDLIMLVGEDCNSDSVVTDLKSTYDKDVVKSTYKPSGDLNWISHQPLIAFCGIARPENFFYTLEKLGGIIYQKLEFPDHHQFASSDADRLLNLAHDTGYQLVTTEKDLIRLLHRSGSLETLRKKTQTLAIDLSLDSQTEVKLNTYIKNTLDRFLED